MSLAPVPEFADFVKAHLRRSEWGQFPDVVIHAQESLIKKHPLYAAAKSGDFSAAGTLVFETTSLNPKALETASLDIIAKLCENRGGKQPFLLPIHAFEAEGRNVIPRIMAQIMGNRLSLPVEEGVWQISQVRHTGASGYARLAWPAIFGIFDGTVKPENYFLVDDFVGQGGTLANLKGFLESRGATVIGATTLTGKAYSAKLKLTEETLRNLRGKYGTELEEWWIAAFGYGFGRLTESEARYLIRADDAYTITARIAAAGRGRD